ncbi:MAG: carbon-nitrogen hydrolase family protein [Solirubrobacterales bacterium]|nr:carbon-nitrogen hydrolase family protein [Solirubrobacterales bacterium]
MTRIAVIQPALALGEVEANLVRIEELIRDAHREHDPDVILVPEGCSSPNVFARVLLGSARPIDGQPLRLLAGLARELGCLIGGGFVAVRGKDTFGTYVLAEPDGSTHLHDKDIPTAWENNYYRRGDDEGVIHSNSLGCEVGLMSGWEWARSGTSRRVRQAGARVVLGGMCWPSMPTNWPGPLKLLTSREHRIWKQQARALPGQVARMTGAPVAIASHVGPITGETPLVPGLSWPTTMIGESQICDRDGTVLARLSEEDGEGHICAEVELAEPAPSESIPDRFWIPKMTAVTHVAWHAMNTHGFLSYRIRRARKGFPWQDWPSGDLPDEIPASDPADYPVATS